MREIERGNTERLQVTIRDRDGNLTDPDQSGGDYQITVTIEDSSETKDVDDVTMTRSSEGVFYYDWNPASDLTVGNYNVEVTATISSKTFINRDTISLVDVA